MNITVRKVQPVTNSATTFNDLQGLLESVVGETIQVVYKPSWQNDPAVWEGTLLGVSRWTAGDGHDVIILEDAIRPGGTDAPNSLRRAHNPLAIPLEAVKEVRHGSF